MLDANVRLGHIDVLSTSDGDRIVIPITVIEEQGRCNTKDNQPGCKLGRNAIELAYSATPSFCVL